MLRTKSALNWLTRSAVAACATFALVAPVSASTVLLNDTFADGSRLETNLPTESRVFASSAADVSVAPGALNYATQTASRRLATYFTPSTGYNLADNEYLKASMTFTPNGTIAASSSKAFRFGLFGDDSARISADGFNDAGGSGNPWGNAYGYAVFLDIGSNGTAAPLQLGKRNDTSGTVTSLMGTGSAFAPQLTGGDPVTFAAGSSYKLELVLERISSSLLTVRANLYQGATLISTFAADDNGVDLGTNPIYNGFDLFALRTTSAASTADSFQFTNFYVETGAIPEPASLGLLALGGLTLLRRRHA